MNQLIVKQISIARKIVGLDSHLKVSSGSNTCSAMSGYMLVYMVSLQNQGLSADTFLDLFLL